MAELEIHEKRVYEKNISTVLTEEIHFSGELNFTRDLMIKGEFYGAIKASGNLYIEESAYVEAEISAGGGLCEGPGQGQYRGGHPGGASRFGGSHRGYHRPADRHGHGMPL